MDEENQTVNQPNVPKIVNVFLINSLNSLLGIIKKKIIQPKNVIVRELKSF